MSYLVSITGFHGAVLLLKKEYRFYISDSQNIVTDKTENDFLCNCLS